MTQHFPLDGRSARSVRAVALTHPEPLDNLAALAQSLESGDRIIVAARCTLDELGLVSVMRHLDLLGHPIRTHKQFPDQIDFLEIGSASIFFCPLETIPPLLTDLGTFCCRELTGRCAREVEAEP